MNDAKSGPALGVSLRAFFATAQTNRPQGGLYIYTAQATFGYPVRQAWGTIPGGSIMKRSLLVATGVLALAAVSKPLFAAETETPAPIERAAPAAERAPAPAAERAPAQERRARPARQAQPRQQTSQVSQSTQQTWTGFQGGGFGGGNVGGAGFADNVCGSHTGVFIPSQSSSSSSQPPVICQALNTSRPNTGSASGGGFIGWGTLIPGTPFYLGAEAMISANNVKNNTR